MAWKDKKHVKSAWVSTSSRDDIKEKPWGSETTWSGFAGIHGKTLFIRSGHRTSLKYHQLKSEVLMLRSGSAEVQFGDELSFTDPVAHPIKTQVMAPGDILLVQSGSPYRITALEDCEIIEIGDNRGDGPVRIEDDYGRIVKGKTNVGS